jgi:hypothetical protein
MRLAALHPLGILPEGNIEDGVPRAAKNRGDDACLLYPPLEGEGRPLERSESGRGGVNRNIEKITPPRSLSLATLPLQGRVKQEAQRP